MRCMHTYLRCKCTTKKQELVAMLDALIAVLHSLNKNEVEDEDDKLWVCFNILRDSDWVVKQWRKNSGKNVIPC